MASIDPELWVLVHGVEQADNWPLRYAWALYRSVLRYMDWCVRTEPGPILAQWLSTWGVVAEVLGEPYHEASREVDDWMDRSEADAPEDDPLGPFRQLREKLNTSLDQFHALFGHGHTLGLMGSSVAQRMTNWMWQRFLGSGAPVAIPTLMDYTAGLCIGDREKFLSILYDEVAEAIAHG